MKTQLNEIKRMQQLAGIITENEYQEALVNEASNNIKKLGNAFLKLGKQLQSVSEEDSESVIEVGNTFINNGKEAGFEKYQNLDTALRDEIFEDLYDKFGIDLDEFNNFGTEPRFDNSPEARRDFFEKEGARQRAYIQDLIKKGILDKDGNIINEKISIDQDNDIPSLGDIVNVVYKNKILPGVFRFVGKVGSKAEIQKLSGDGQKILGNFIFPMDSITKI
jgi:hypothetical protein